MTWPMNLRYCLTAVWFSLTSLQVIFPRTVYITIRPSIIVTSKIFTVSVESNGNNFTAYKYSFGSWVIETSRKAVTHRYHRSGWYTLKVTARADGLWMPWTIKNIEVFDYATVVQSQCEVTILPSIHAPIETLTPGETIAVLLNFTLIDCYGAGHLIVNSSANEVLLTKSFLSYGRNQTRIVIFNSTYCSESNVIFQIVLLSKVISKTISLASFWNPKNCQSEVDSNHTFNLSSPPASRTPIYNSTQFIGQQNALSSPTSIPVVINGTLNIVVAVFFATILGFYLTITFLNYIENKKSLRSVVNLTDIKDEVMYEVQFHVGSAFSVQSTACQIQFTVYGASNAIGPISLPISSFEQDGIASFLISANGPLGEVGTICIFCKDMDLRCDWYLRKVEILSHSQKPSGSHWGSDDIIKNIAEFECHSWFQPAVRTDSVAQVFHSSIIGSKPSLLLYYLKRFHQLFSQKHILTSWRCSFGANKFSRTQRLSFLYTLWLVIICMTSFHIVKNGISKASQNEHIYRVGILLLNESAVYFALSHGISAYAIGIVLCFLVKLVHGQALDDDSAMPGHVDNRGHRIYKIGQKMGGSDSYNLAKDTSLHDLDSVSSTVNGCVLIDEQSSGSVNSKRDVVKEGHLNSDVHTLRASPSINHVHSGNGIAKSSLDMNHVVVKLDSSTNNEGRDNIIFYNDERDRYNERDEKQEEAIIFRGRDSNGYSLQNETSRDGNGNGELADGCVEVQLFNRETLPTVKEDQWKLLIFKFSARLFWIAFTILMLFCLFYSLVNSTDWSRNVAYHWLSYHVLAFVFSCFFCDSARVMLYILLITIKERRQLYMQMKGLTFDDHTMLLLSSKHALKERDEFCCKEYPSNKMKFAQDYHRLQGKFRDLFVLGIFVISLLALTTWTVDKRSYMINKTLTRELFNVKDLLLIQKKKTQVYPIANFWSWFEKTLFPVIDSTKRDVSLQGFHLIGKRLRIVQKRVIPGRCNIADQIKDVVSDCSLGFNQDNEDFATYGPGWGILQPGHAHESLLYSWKYEGNERYSMNGSSHAYSMRGYVGDFEVRRANKVLNELKKFKWIDRYSRHLFLEAFLFESSLNLMSQISIMIELQTSTFISIDTSFLSFSIVPESSQSHEWMHIVETVALVLTIYLVYDIFKRKRRTSMSWISLWLIIQIILIILSFTTLSLYFYKDYNVDLLALESISPSRKDDIYRKVISLQRSLEYILAMLNIVALIFLTKPLFTLGLFDDMYTAVSRTMRDMKGIAMETVVLLIGLGCWANLAFAGQISSFSSLRTTFPTLMDMLVRPDNSALYEVRFFGPLYLFTYFFIMILLVTNIFISSVESSYSEAREVIDQIRRETVFKLLFRKFKKKRLLAEHSYLSFESRTSRSTRRRKQQTHRTEHSHDAAENIENDDKMSSTDGQSKAVEPGHDPLITSLEQSIAKLELTVNKKVLYEHVEDKILLSVMTEKWNKVVLRRPPLSVISLYKPLIRK